MQALFRGLFWTWSLTVLISHQALVRGLLPLKSSVVGDPHFSGFDGSTYEFEGSVDTHFNLLSDFAHQLNALFTAGEEANYGEGSTVMRGIGFKYFNDRIQVSLLKDGCLTKGGSECLWTMQVTANEQPLELGALEQLPGGFWVEVQEEKVVITTPVYKIGIEHPTQEKEDDRLDVTVDMIALPASEVHGVLGQTYQLARLQAQQAAGDEHALGTPVEFTLEGEPGDYVIDHLFADNFMHNRFGSLPDLVGKGDVALALRQLRRRTLLSAMADPVFTAASQ